MTTHWRSITDNNGKVYKSVAEAGRNLGVSGTTVRNHLKGTTASIRGYIFRYTEEVIDE